jgi:hypothetical protein
MSGLALNLLIDYPFDNKHFSDHGPRNVKHLSTASYGPQR